MAPEVRKYIWDAKEAAARALRFTAGKSLDDYLNDELLRAAVERQFLILGEALGRLRQLDPGLAARVADLNQAVALRNQLAHGYAEIDDVIVWGVVAGPLTQLLSELESL
ncbi:MULTISPECIES: DUF86 domain-containing protein [Roseateles]|jgi:uncharacterized protein with HEPN domain|uniref:Uncharacterized protein with HEPN domain n=1 Tax=Pelomonas aquatica TaxID=431058 RepID=A0ABU1ZE83_9BURK|nr:MULTISPECIES: HepT-like ribonuclease domain-containing protein [Roseateles]KQY85494.1 hypothetical protein ASD35_23040 [Pelomonas sp. Root1444]MDR7298942.1 uncharacterized protein with HEPN domain [Pelomonas aquatica]